MFSSVNTVVDSFNFEGVICCALLLHLEVSEFRLGGEVRFGISPECLQGFSSRYMLSCLNSRRTMVVYV